MILGQESMIITKLVSNSRENGINLRVEFAKWESQNAIYEKRAILILKQSFLAVRALFLYKAIHVQH